MLYVIAVGPGDGDMVTLQAVKVLENCELVLGWKSVVDRVARYVKGEVKYLTYGNQHVELAKAAEHSRSGSACVVTHGDPTVSDWELLERLRALNVEYKILHGVSSVLVALGRLGLDLADVVFISEHASAPQRAEEWSHLAERRVLLIFPPPTPSGPSEVAERLARAGLSRCRTVVLEDLTLPSERRWEGFVDELASSRRQFSHLSILSVDCRV